MPIIFITVMVMCYDGAGHEGGRCGIFDQPFGDNVLLSAIRHALDRSHSALGREAEMQVLRDCYALLTRREGEVMALVVSGLLNNKSVVSSESARLR